MMLILIGLMLILSGDSCYQVQGSNRACNADCGQKNENGRIVGGRYVTTSNEHPWMGYFTIGNEFVCACSLISDRFVLTAEHCIHFLKFLRLQENIRVHFGTNNICENDTFSIEASSKNSSKVTREISKIYSAEFSIQNLTNDITLFELNEPISFTNEISPIFLPQKNHSDYRFGSVIGWGRITERGPTSCVLKETELPILKFEECLKKFDKISIHNKIGNKQICTLYDPVTDVPSDACQQDSGGPLIYQRADNSYEQIGIVSWGLGCARENSPGIYTKVSEYVEWIIDIVNKSNGCLCI